MDLRVASPGLVMMARDGRPGSGDERFETLPGADMAGDPLRPCCGSFLYRPVPGLLTSRARAGPLMRSMSYSACVFSATQPISVGLIAGLISRLEVDCVEKE